MFDQMMQGFSAAMTANNLLYLFLGVFYGTWLGVLPGIGPIQGSALLVPFTFGLAPTTAILMLAGVLYGSFYGGSTTSILLNIPGEVASVMTAVEGYKLNLQGRAGPALGMSAISSFFAGTLAVVGMMIVSAPLAQIALAFGPAETFGLFICAFTLLVSLAGKSVLKALAVGAVGVIMSTIGVEPVRAASRLTFGVSDLTGGIGFIPVALGLFAIPEAIKAMEKPGMILFKKQSLKIRNLLPSLQDFKDSRSALPVGALIGFFCGILPGVGGTIASFLAYGIQRRIAVKPELFGKGSMEAIAAVEGANNSGSTASLIPMLTFGIPGGATSAIIMGAMIIHGLRPGPLLFQQNPQVVWTLIASMYLGNVMLFILNFPLIGIWVSFLRLPQRTITIAVLVISVTGVYASEGNLGGVIIMFIFGVVGYIFDKYEFPPSPLLLALILTEQMEAALRQSLMLSAGSVDIFFKKPICLGFLTVAAVSILLQTPIFTRSIGRMRRLIVGG
jgi:putative tricarboxylic transport membrane protein